MLFGQWGFGKRMTKVYNCIVMYYEIILFYCPQGLTALFHGAPGTGKSLAAEAIGYEVGKPLKVLCVCACVVCVCMHAYVSVCLLIRSILSR